MRSVRCAATLVATGFSWTAGKDATVPVRASAAISAIDIALQFVGFFFGGVAKDLVDAYVGVGAGVAYDLNGAALRMDDDAFDATQFEGFLDGANDFVGARESGQQK